MPVFEDVKKSDVSQTEMTASSSQIGSMMTRFDLKAPPPMPAGKPEFTDGTNWYYLATENYVINALSQVSLAPCLVATTQNLNATYDNGASGVGASLVSNSNQVLMIDGVSLDSVVTNTRVLVKDQNTPAQNGIYIVGAAGSTTSPWVLVRSSDFNSSSQIIAGEIVTVISGTSNTATAWMQTTLYFGTMGSTSIVFANLTKSAIQNILATVNQTTVSIANNIVTIGLASNPVLPGNAGVTVPGGGNSQRSTTLVAGTLRYNNGSS